MKKLIPIILLYFLIPSCEKGETKWFCWDYTSVVYGKADRTCSEDPTEVERYKQRIYDFYEGGCTDIQCVLLADTIKSK